MLTTAARKKLELAAWRKTHADFKGRDADGIRRMLYLNPKNGATESWPLSDLPQEFLEERAGIKPSR